MHRLLIASITNAPAEILTPHLETILWQTKPEGWEFDIAYLVDRDAPDATKEALEAAGTNWTHAAAKPAGARHAVTEQTHEWSVPTFHWLAKEKQKILDGAAEVGYDAVFLVDSDLLLSPDTISSLLSCDKPVVSGIFWTRWSPGQPPLPNAWLSHPYGLEGRGFDAQEFLQRLNTKQLTQVGGLGACTLFRGEALERPLYWPLLPDLPEGGMWQGEDRHFSVRAGRERLPLWVDPWPEIFHVYRPSDISKIPLAMQLLGSMGRELVSAIIEPLEEPNLTGYQHFFRGAADSPELLPQLQEAFASLVPGSEAVLNLNYPPHWPAYPGQQRVLRLRLLHAAPRPATDSLHGMR